MSPAWVRAIDCRVYDWMAGLARLWVARFSVALVITYNGTNGVLYYKPYPIIGKVKPNLKNRRRNAVCATAAGAGDGRPSSVSRA